MGADDAQPDVCDGDNAPLNLSAVGAIQEAAPKLFDEVPDQEAAAKLSEVGAVVALDLTKKPQKVNAEGPVDLSLNFDQIASDSALDLTVNSNKANEIPLQVTFVVN